jgi:hypothetical protein
VPLLGGRPDVIGQHEVPEPALATVETQRRGCARCAVLDAGVTMLGVSVLCGTRTRGAALASPGAACAVQLLGSCRPGARRLSRGYQLVLFAALDQIHRPVRGLNLDVEIAALPCETIDLLADGGDVEGPHHPDF